MGVEFGQRRRICRRARKPMKSSGNSTQTAPFLICQARTPVPGKLRMRQFDPQQKFSVFMA
jgi:hypothetical protein